MGGDDDARHQREEAERRAKRKASKMSKTEAQLEKERLRREHREKILQKHGGGRPSSGSGGGGSSSSARDAKRAKASKAEEKSIFQELFTQRASGFQIEFKFRNAPPRPPVGPTFVGHSLDYVLQNQQCKIYKPLNSVEVNYTWKLHSEADLGVPLAPSAMDPRSYITSKNSGDKAAKTSEDAQMLGPEDAGLLDWTGSMGDTAADNLKRRREQSRAAARQALAGKGAIPAPNILSANAAAATASRRSPSKKAFSRVLKEGMQTWMKKTTYLSNDYSRKVHDFKSLAQTKQELEEELKVKQVQVTKRRSASAVAHQFLHDKHPLVHPDAKKKNLKPKAIFEVLPNAEQWGRPFTHLVIDKKPAIDSKKFLMGLEAFNQAIVAHVEKKKANARMSCQVFTPISFPVPEDQQEHSYEAIQSFDLDVIPLKEGEDMPATHFCIWVDREKGVATYLPIASRVQLSTGRPAPNPGIRKITRRALSAGEVRVMEERQAEVDRDMAEKHDLEPPERHHDVFGGGVDDNLLGQATTKSTKHKKDDEDDGEDDFGDDSSDSGDEALFGGGGNKTIVAEH